MILNNYYKKSVGESIKSLLDSNIKVFKQWLQ